MMKFARAKTLFHDYILLEIHFLGVSASFAALSSSFLSFLRSASIFDSRDSQFQLSVISQQDDCTRIIESMGENNQEIVSRVGQ